MAAYIDFLANGDVGYVPAAPLRRLDLTAYERDLYFLFMHGEPNSGKSVFQDVLQRLLGSYIKSASPDFFMRQPTSARSSFTSSKAGAARS